LFYCFNPVKIFRHSTRGTIVSRVRYGLMIIAVMSMGACQPEGQTRETDRPEKDSALPARSPDTSGQRPVFPGGDTFQQACNFIQAQAETLLEEYHRPETAAERLREIPAELRKLEREWKQTDCQQVFGFMIPEIPRSNEETPAVQ
jgi:hypothetical protein